jgi:SWI/SNF-related matrix-associated actin-dependent regulator 1 of chromatin subfamily A
MALSLDFNQAANVFFLRVPRGIMPVDALMADYGLNFSVPDSTGNEAVLFTRDPYAAVSFHEHATPTAKAKLDWIYREVIASSALTGAGRHLTMPYGKELIPYQEGDADYILNRTHALDADEPGLGKTPTAIVIANEIQAQRVLVVCPASIRDQWERRVREWTTLPDPFIYVMKVSRYGANTNAEWLIVSYELARNPGILRALTKQSFDLLIIDEVHYAKDPRAGRSLAIFGHLDGRADDGESIETVNACLMDVSKKVLALSGTPLPNRPSEAYVLARHLNWEGIDWMSEKAFRERFNPQSKGKSSSGKVYTNEEEGRLPELQNRLRASIMCRHLMIDVRHQLKAKFPDPVYDLIYLEETNAVRLALEAEHRLDIDPNDLMGVDFEILGAISSVRKMMGEAMAPQVAEYLKVLLTGGESKLVIFTWHQTVTDYLVEQLRPWSPVWTDGRNTAKKDSVVQAFIHDPRVGVLIGNILTLGTGTDEIQHIANHCLFAEPDWVDGNNDQAVKRLARFGQLSRVLADFFVVHDSMAEKVLGTAIRKGRVVHKALDMKPALEIENW